MPELRDVTTFTMPPGLILWRAVILWLLAQVDKISHLLLSQRSSLEAGHSHVPPPYVHPPSLAREDSKHHRLGCCSRALLVAHVCCLRRNSAWSPIRSAFSLSKFFLITATATTTAWLAHPHLLNLAAHVLHLDFKDSVTAFQTSFFSFLSLVFAIYSGNTMAFLYDVSLKAVCFQCWSCDVLAT